MVKKSKNTPPAVIGDESFGKRLARIRKAKGITSEH